MVVTTHNACSQGRLDPYIEKEMNFSLLWRPEVGSVLEQVGTEPPYKKLDLTLVTYPRYHFKP